MGARRRVSLRQSQVVYSVMGAQIPPALRRLSLGFRGGAVHLCSESSGVEPGEGQMADFGGLGWTVAYSYWE